MMIKKDQVHADFLIGACIRTGWPTEEVIPLVYGASQPEVDRLVEHCLERKEFSLAFDATYLGASEAMKDRVVTAHIQNRRPFPPGPPSWFRE